MTLDLTVLKFVALGAALYLTSACGGRSKSHDDSPAAAGGNGSCVQPEGFDSTLSLCRERQEAESDFAKVCGLFGGTWSASPCDEGQYATRCTQDVQESVNDGPATTVHDIYYYKAESKEHCMGASEQIQH